MSTATMTIEHFAQRVQDAYQARIRKHYPASAAVYEQAEVGTYSHDEWTVKVHHGPKYTRVDVGHSGRFMVVNATGEIFGIKGYGVIHRGHRYGTLQDPSPVAFAR